jgi:hypothetical protein
MNHVREKLSAYCNDELTVEERRDVGLHLESCARCKREFEEIKLGVEFARMLPIADAPLGTWNEIERKRGEGEKGRKGEKTFSSLFHSFPPPVLAACAIVVLLMGLGVVVYLMRDGKKEIVKDKSNSFQVENIAGAPKVGMEEIKDTARLSVGEYLETDDKSKAKIEVANIGKVEVAPNSRVKLVGTSEKEHRLALDEGKLEADITAPPRIFVVDTPSAVATDLGCKYTLEVDKDGNSFLHVTFGWVLLQRDEYESLVPAGAMCQTRKDKGIGTPYFDDASDKFVDALKKFDFENGGTAALKIVIKESRDYDTLTLWHLLPRVKGKDRELIYDALASFMKPPHGVTREGILKLDKEMMDRWRQEIGIFWFPD